LSSQRFFSKGSETMSPKADCVANRTRKRRETIMMTRVKRGRVERGGYSNKAPDYSKLPTEILWKIFGYFKKEDNAIKPLTETCLRFKAICDPRLYLHINYDRILKNKESYPVIKRSYDLIRIVGTEIDPNLNNTKGLVATSKHTAKTLIIGETREYRVNTYAHLKTLAGVIGLLPKVNDIRCESVKPTTVQLQFDALEAKHFPPLKSLKKLFLKDCQGPLIQCFTKASEIEDFQIEGGSYRSSMTNLKAFTVKQSNLRTLTTIVTDPRTRNRFEMLKVLKYPISSFMRLAQSHRNILKNAPNIEHIKLMKTHYEYGRAEYPLHTWIARFKIPSLKTLELEGRISEDYFDLDRLLQSFPGLETFVSTNVKWERGKEVVYIRQAPIAVMRARHGIFLVDEDFFEDDDDPVLVDNVAVVLDAVQVEPNEI
jgi:F-box-like